MSISGDNRVNIPCDDDDIDLQDMIEKGYRKDVSICVDGKIIRIVFYTAEILLNQLNIWKDLNVNNFMVNGVLIVQDKIDNASVREELHRLIDAGAFSEWVNPT